MPIPRPGALNGVPELRHEAVLVSRIPHAMFKDFVFGRDTACPRRNLLKAFPRPPANEVITGPCAAKAAIAVITAPPPNSLYFSLLAGGIWFDLASELADAYISRLSRRAKH